MLFQPTGGAYADLGPDDTAFGGPRTGYGVYGAHEDHLNANIPPSLSPGQTKGP